MALVCHDISLDHLTQEPCELTLKHLKKLNIWGKTAVDKYAWITPSMKPTLTR